MCEAEASYHSRILLLLLLPPSSQDANLEQRTKPPVLKFQHGLLPPTNTQRIKFPERRSVKLHSHTYYSFVLDLEPRRTNLELLPLPGVGGAAAFR
ncbi:hypothetical protein V8F06_004296 [Rhypophila decipiens]